MSGFLLAKDSSREVTLKRIAAFLEILPRNQTWEVLVQPFKRRRSLAQNSALWGVAYKVLSEHTGFEPQDLHEYFLGEWSGWKVITVMGQKRRVPVKRSKKLSKTEFADFYAFIQRRSAETVGVFVPDPDPNFWQQRHEQAA